MPIDLLPSVYLQILYQNKNTQNSIFIHFKNVKTNMLLLPIGYL